ncbi:MAG: sulfatase modifying factor 1 [Polyangiales bacterium]|jgi:sulfatase modifying factor 1
MRARLGCVAFVLALAAPGGAQQRVTVEESALVRINAGWFARGLHPMQIAEAVMFCRNTSPASRDAFVCHESRFASETPRRRIFLSPYYIDRFEVTRERYGECVGVGGCLPARSGNGDERFSQPAMPVTGVTWDDARNFCRWAGGELPTESQWERAARGSGGRRFPWGSLFNDRLANHGSGARLIDGFEFVAPVGSYVEGRSPDGLYDMAGNVWEWTLDAFDPEREAWAGEVPVDPRGADSSGHRIIRGGSWRSQAVDLRTTTRIPVGEQRHSPDLGFRCVFDAL